MTPLVALILLTSELPDPGQPAFVPLAGSVDLFLGGLLALAKRVPPEERSRWMGAGTWAGIGFGGAVWIIAITMDRL
jgi:hypothetical protein